MRECKICRWEKKDELLRLWREGKSIRELARWCRENGLNVSHTWLRVHLLYHTVEPEETILEKVHESLKSLIQSCLDDLQEVERQDISFDRKMRMKSDLLRRFKELSELLLEFENKLKISEVERLRRQIQIILECLEILPEEWQYRVREEISRRVNLE